MEEPLIEIIPDHITFTCSASGISPVQLKIINKSVEDILFRIKLNTPQSYYVKPAQGRILTGEQIDIQIVAKDESLKQTPPSRIHRFLIEYTKATQGTSIASSQWNNPDSKTYSSILQVAFKSEEEDAQIKEETKDAIVTEFIRGNRESIKESGVTKTTNYITADGYINSALEIECV